MHRLSSAFSTMTLNYLVMILHPQRMGANCPLPNHKNTKHKQISSLFPNHSFPSVVNCWWISRNLRIISFVISSKCLYSIVNSILLDQYCCNKPASVTPAVDNELSSTNEKALSMSSFCSFYSIRLYYSRNIPGSVVLYPLP